MSQPKLVTPGQAAYMKWVSLLNVPLGELPLWARLSVGEQAAWEDVALAAIEQYTDDKE